MRRLYHIASVKPRQKEKDDLRDTKGSQTYVKRLDTSHIKEKSTQNFIAPQEIPFRVNVRWGFECICRVKVDGVHSEVEFKAYKVDEKNHKQADIHKILA